MHSFLYETAEKSDLKTIDHLQFPMVFLVIDKFETFFIKYASRNLESNKLLKRLGALPRLYSCILNQEGCCSH